MLRHKTLLRLNNAKTHNSAKTQNTTPKLNNAKTHNSTKTQNTAKTE